MALERLPRYTAQNFSFCPRKELPKYGPQTSSISVTASWLELQIIEPFAKTE